MIREVRMTNCQSWKDASFSLAYDKLNVIIADNGIGKSVFMKMLKITACPKIFSREEQAALIRWGASFAQILFIFESGAAAATRVYTNRVLYLYKAAGSSVWEQSYEPSEAMLRDVGLLADVKNKFIANIIDTDQKLLLVDDKLKSNYDFMKLLIFCENLENARERITEEKKRVQIQERELAVRLGSLRHQIEECEYVDVNKVSIELYNLRIAQECLYALIELAEQSDMLFRLTGVKRNYNLLFKELELLEVLESIDLVQLYVPNTSTASLTDIAYLEAFEEVLSCLKDIQVFEYRGAYERELMCLEALEELDLDVLKVLPEPLASKAEIKLLELLEEVVDFIMQLEKENLIQQDTLGMIEKLECAFAESGKVVQCPIYGKVVYDGKECVYDR